MTPTFRFHKKYQGHSKTKAVILLSGWRTNQAQYWLFSRLIANQGYRCLTYTYDAAILQPNVKTTAANISLVVADIVQEIAAFKKQGATEIILFGTSLGSLLAILSANQSDDVDKLILNTSGLDMAKTVWSWDDIFSGFKDTLVNQGITLEQLCLDWQSINPRDNLDRIANKEIVLLASRKDKIIPFTQADELRVALQKNNPRLIFQTTDHFGHLLFGAINLCQAPRYLKGINAQRT